MKISKYRNVRVYTDDNLNIVPRGKHTITFDSKLEYQQALALEHGRKAGKITWWRRCTMQDAWDFSRFGYRTATRYTPDFVLEIDGKKIWIECKGYNYRGSLTKLRRAINHFPDRQLFVRTRTGLFTASEYIEEEKRKKRVMKKLRKEGVRR